jgi:hypothetical protein
MKKSKLGFIVLLVGLLYSCGPSPDDYTTENVKNNCDCLKVRGELTKYANEVLAAESDKVARKELQETDAYKQWTRKSEEIHQFCSKNFKDYFGDDKCPEYKSFHDEFEKSHELYQSDF